MSEVAAQTQTCDPEQGGCGQTKAIEEFYFTGPGRRWRKRLCRDCDNARPRALTVTKAIRNRARHRASARLLEMYPQVFNRLLEEELVKAVHEHEVLQAIGAYEDAPEEVVRLKPGRRRSGQETTERIDVARCRRCHTNHDRGHICPSCGSTEEESNGREE